MESRCYARLFAGLALGLCLLLAPLATPALAGEEENAGARVPFLWEVQTKPKIYLFGTIHVADERVTTHPPVVVRALAESQALYTELDFAKMAKMGADLLKHIMLPDGKTLSEVAPKELIEKLDGLVARYEIPEAQAAGFKTFRPWLTAIQVPVLVNALRKAKDVAAKAAAAGTKVKPADPAAAQALDVQLYMGAKGAGKLVGGLEKPEEQFSIFNELSMESQLEMLSASLDELAKLDEPSEDGDTTPKVDPVEVLIRIYLAGDENAFYDIMQEAMGKDAEAKEFMERLLDRRNVIMVRRMLEAAERHPKKTMFVAVGAGHYPGPMGIVKLLRETGYRVRRINSVAALEKAWPIVQAPSPSSRRRPRGGIRVGPFCLPRLWCP